METIRVPRTGLPDLEFIGHQVASAQGVDDDGATKGRCHHVSVYQAEDGEYVVCVDFQTDRPGETSDHFVETASSVEDLDAALSLYDPTERLAPPQPDANMKERQTLLSTLTRRYDLQVHEVLLQLQKAAVATR